MLGPYRGEKAAIAADCEFSFRRKKAEEEVKKTEEGVVGDNI
jgi:hypothetical protein